MGYALIPAIADLNHTHATNPTWVGHARFHVVWQVVSYIGVGIIALVLIWTPHKDKASLLWLVMALSAAVYAGFFAASFGKRLYGGENYDPNGILPYRPPVLGQYVSFEVNISIFTVMALIVAASAACLLLADG